MGFLSASAWTSPKTSSARSVCHSRQSCCYSSVIWSGWRHGTSPGAPQSFCTSAHCAPVAIRHTVGPKCRPDPQTEFQMPGKPEFPEKSGFWCFKLRYTPLHRYPSAGMVPKGPLVNRVDMPVQPCPEPTGPRWFGPDNRHNSPGPPLFGFGIFAWFFLARCSDTRQGKPKVAVNDNMVAQRFGTNWWLWPRYIWKSYEILNWKIGFWRKIGSFYPISSKFAKTFPPAFRHLAMSKEQ